MRSISPLPLVGRDSKDSRGADDPVSTLPLWPTSALDSTSCAPALSAASTDLCFAGSPVLSVSDCVLLGTLAGLSLLAVAAFAADVTGFFGWSAPDIRYQSLWRAYRTPLHTFRKLVGRARNAHAPWRALHMLPRRCDKCGRKAGRNRRDVPSDAPAHSSWPCKCRHSQD